MAKYALEFTYESKYRQRYFSLKDAKNEARDIFEFGNRQIKRIDVIKNPGRREIILSTLLRKKEGKMDEQEDYLQSAKAIIDGE